MYYKYFMAMHQDGGTQMSRDAERAAGYIGMTLRVLEFEEQADVRNLVRKGLLSLLDGTIHANRIAPVPA